MVGVEPGKSGFNLLKIVVIDLHHVAAKGSKFLIQRLGVHHVLGPSVDLETVDIHDDACPTRSAR